MIERLTEKDILSQFSTEKDYKDMRRFQGEYITLKQENAELRVSLDDEREHHGIYAQHTANKIVTLKKALELAINDLHNNIIYEDVDKEDIYNHLLQQVQEAQDGK